MCGVGSWEPRLHLALVKPIGLPQSPCPERKSFFFSRPTFPPVSTCPTAWDASPRYLQFHLLQDAWLLGVWTKWLHSLRITAQQEATWGPEIPTHMSSLKAGSQTLGLTSLWWGLPSSSGHSRACSGDHHAFRETWGKGQSLGYRQSLQQLLRIKRSLHDPKEFAHPSPSLLLLS